MRVRIDPYDTWNMDSTLALIILPMLKQLRDTKQGVPAAVPYLEQTSNAGQSCFDFYADGDDAAFSAAEREWERIFDKMIFAFEHILDTSWEDGFRSGVIDWQEVETKDANGNVLHTILNTGPDDTYTCNYAGLEHVWDRIDEGLQLFGKHYRSLWD